MTKSTRRTRTATRSGIAAASVVSLALGAFAVVGPGPVATEAAAAELSGGIREKSGAVEEGAQQASDLPAGSCVVKSGETSGNQAGFRWSTLEPSGTSPSKTLWGLSVSFDNS
ncbi:adhesin domain containing protein, partial [Corynebacterium aquatimens]